MCLNGTGLSFQGSCHTGHGDGRAEAHLLGSASAVPRATRASACVAHARACVCMRNCVCVRACAARVLLWIGPRCAGVCSYHYWTPKGLRPVR
jgi:hypothetical protein